MDKGPWQLFQGKQGELCGLLSDDFAHDVVLYVNGDFANPEQYQSYCEWLRDKLNSPALAPQRERETSHG